MRSLTLMQYQCFKTKQNILSLLQRMDEQKFNRKISLLSFSIIKRRGQTNVMQFRTSDLSRGCDLVLLPLTC